MGKIRQICGVSEFEDVVKSVKRLKEDSTNFKTMIWRFGSA